MSHGFWSSSAASVRWMSKTTFEDELRRTGRLIYTNVGDSMQPLIRQDRDLVVIEPAKGRLKRNDVPLYRRDSGQYVLHRILRVRAQDYVLCGDNRTGKETGITDRQIVGVLTAVIRGGKTLSVHSLRYRLYVCMIRMRRPLRILRVKLRGLLRRGRQTGNQK